MTVKIRFLNKRGDEQRELTVEEARNLIKFESGRYICFNTNTHTKVAAFEVQDGESYALMPIIRGG